MINTHGLMIDLDNLAKASHTTVNWPKNSGGCTRIMYNAETGEVWTADEVGNHFAAYHDPAIIVAGRTVRHMSQQSIADMIQAAMRYRKEARG